MRGLGLGSVSCEAYLQHNNIVQRLENFDAHLLHACRDFHSEKVYCMEQVKLKMESVIQEAKCLHKALRENEFLK